MWWRRESKNQERNGAKIRRRTIQGVQLHWDICQNQHECPGGFSGNYVTILLSHNSCLFTLVTLLSDKHRDEATNFIFFFYFKILYSTFFVMIFADDYKIPASITYHMKKEIEIFNQIFFSCRHSIKKISGGPLFRLVWRQRLLMNVLNNVNQECSLLLTLLTLSVLLGIQLKETEN